MILYCTRYVTFLGTLLATAAAQQGTTTSPLPYPHATRVEQGGEAWLTIRVVDDILGEPLPAAEIVLVPEHATPLPATFWSTRSATADADGFLRVRIDDIERQWSWILVRAPGHATVACRDGIGSPVLRLPRGVDVPVQILDWRGQPVVGANLGFCRGCGHTPDLALADTGTDGIGVLHGIDTHDGISDVYVRHPNTDLGYDEIGWRPGEPPVRLYPGPGEAITGVVLDHLGKPIAGAPISPRDIHRGPWAITATDGTFTLLGAPLDCDLAVVLPDREVYFDRPSRFPATWHLPAPDGQRGQGGTVTPSPVDLVPPATATISVRVVADDAQVDLDVDTPPLVPRPSFEAADPDEQGLRAVSVPANGPFALVLRGAFDQRRFFVFDDRKALPAGPVALPWFAKTRIRGKVVDPAGRPIATRLRVLPWHGMEDDAEERTRVPFTDSADGTFDLGSEEVGTRVLEVQPTSPGLRRRLIPFVLPHRADSASVELGTIQCTREPVLRVLDAAGKPFREAHADFARANMSDPGAQHTFAVDAEGGWLGPDLRDGDAIVVTAPVEHAMPLRTVLRGDGPWTIRIPDNELRVVVVDEQGERVDAQLFWDDAWLQVENVASLRCVRPGPMRLFVTADGLQTAIVDLVVPESGLLEVEVKLPGR